ncbi:MAG: glycine dehydrogenase (aminomethyl-transferring) [Oscillatoriales cyanobacterium CG2_30_44_21]|nr:MAG: glycine dehydrogenase (aminomethyl-transferring) [Oscillatoriales cyanobacterium CG2_30_44_21]
MAKNNDYLADCLDADEFAPTDSFVHRHIGASSTDIQQMLQVIGCDTMEEMIEKTVPAEIRIKQPLQLAGARGEYELLQELKAIASKNQVWRSYIGTGYYNCITPPIIQRNILENPGWYTQYTPYQAEIAQGRLEALLNFQTMIIDLTGLEIANASLLDEGTAAAEAMTMAAGIAKNKGSKFFVSRDCHPQTIAVVKSRAIPLGIEVVVAQHEGFELSREYFGILLQYPASDGAIYDYSEFIAQIHAQNGLAIMAADLLALTLIKSPSELGADIAIGSAQRFGVPYGYGGPHAAYMATKDAYKRQMPGRLIGVSKDVHGRPALRLALQTREQHIRRDKATSNICTAQVLLAIMASMYAVYHGASGLKRIAQRVNLLTASLADALVKLGHTVIHSAYFDTICVKPQGMSIAQVQAIANVKQINLRYLEDGAIAISLDETVSKQDLADLIEIFAVEKNTSQSPIPNHQSPVPTSLTRTSPYLTHPAFNSYHSESELLRYIHRLQSKDLSLTTSMIPLGSCTMKLNATSEMLPVTWTEFGNIHPFAPLAQTQGYQILFQQLEAWLAEITGFAGVSLQPNAGSQGEYAGLSTIRQYHQHRGQANRHICLIPTSAHGTNPASAVMAGMKVVTVNCDSEGNIDVADLRAKAEKHQHELAALMVTYPSTHGVFEESIKDICDIIHYYGGQVYMDGANMNAQVGLCRPGDIGADVCHLNLHKTFCIPHGGGGPGMGPICVAPQLLRFLPKHPFIDGGANQTTISAAPWGSASILTISWVYIALMGAKGLKLATEVAILNANYMAQRLAPHYPILYTGKNGLVAHECIIDLHNCKAIAGIEVDDIAKRLMDYGFHAPTMSWPVGGTMMIEPTESESKAELDRYCEAMIAIKQEVNAIASGEMDKLDNPLKNAPHTAEALLADDWHHSYSRNQAAYPAPWLKEHKFWTSVGRIDNAYGDRNFVCSCLPLEAYES